MFAAWSKRSRQARVAGLAAYHRARGAAGRARPFLLSHLVTGKCNFSCPPCLWKDNRAKGLSTEQIERLYRQAQELSFIGNYIWGGEPLLRKDIGHLAASSRRAGLVTMMNTNGWLLEKRLDEVAPFMDLFVVSLDHSRAEVHDRLRGMPGAHRRVLAGIEALHRRYPSVRVIVNTLIMRENADDLGNMLDLWRSMGVRGYANFIETDLSRSDGMGDRAAHLDVEGERQAEIALFLLERKRAGAPILNTRRYLELFTAGKPRYRCHFPKIFLEIYPDGSVLDCVRTDRPIGNVAQEPLRQILQHPRIQGMIRDGERWCCVHSNADRIDTSNLWDLRPESLASLLGFVSRP